MGPHRRASESTPTVKVWVPPLPKIPQIFESNFIVSSTEKILASISSISSLVTLWCFQVTVFHIFIFCAEFIFLSVELAQIALEKDARSCGG